MKMLNWKIAAALAFNTLMSVTILKFFTKVDDTFITKWLILFIAVMLTLFVYECLRDCFKLYRRRANLPRPIALVDDNLQPETTTGESQPYVLACYTENIFLPELMTFYFLNDAGAARRAGWQMRRYGFEKVEVFKLLLTSKNSTHIFTANAEQ